MSHNNDTQVEGQDHQGVPPSENGYWERKIVAPQGVIICILLGTQAPHPYGFLLWECLESSQGLKTETQPPWTLRVWFLRGGEHYPDSPAQA